MRKTRRSGLETLLLLTKIFGISFTSGVNLYATVALVGLAVRFNVIQNLPEQLHVLANEYVIGVALTMYVCEFFADKIPAFDSFWDSIHTFIRPFSAAFIALMAAGDASIVVKIIAVLLAGSVALTTHTAKAGTRLLINTSPEPVSNSVVSIAEDIGVFVLVALVLTHPFVAASIMAVLLLLIIWQGPKLIGFIIYLFKAIYCKLWSYVPCENSVNLEIMPHSYDAYLNNILEGSERVYLTIGAVFKGSKKRSGYFVVSARRCIILHRSWFRVRHIEVDLQDILRMTFQKNFLTDRLSFTFDPEKQLIITLFKRNDKSIDEIKNLFKSLGVEVVEPALYPGNTGYEPAG
jgi:hypothetical protein